MAIHDITFAKLHGDYEMVAFTFMFSGTILYWYIYYMYLSYPYVEPFHVEQVELRTISCKPCALTLTAELFCTSIVQF